DGVAGGERAFDEGEVYWGGGGVEEDFIARFRERGIEILAPALHAVFRRERAQLLLVPADQDRIGQQPLAVVEAKAAFGADFRDRALEMLIGSHSAGDAEHDDADAPCVLRLRLARGDVHAGAPLPAGVRLCRNARSGSHPADASPCGFRAGRAGAAVLEYVGGHPIAAVFTIDLANTNAHGRNACRTVSIR